MVEVHGWITLRYSDYHSEDSEQNNFLYNFKQFLLRQYAGMLDDQVGRLTSRNGLACFTLTVQHNHLGVPFYPLEIFTWVADNSTGSYGLLHFHDDEDECQHNEFQVYVLKRGRLVKSKDLFLSPYVEEVEQDYDENHPPKD
ncbi:immunity 7 family protein [Hymenobacter weizhouensis]|uniref:immunity 7 family protein n=1 Tax=Hymenobacter sp. YIM 151500-1 TaxID=2987689 RepID=UPI002227B106|nr:immunity 7 family protein [Hymenobacter sp. YIM 151500-1]UYZ63329.1 immunity 7 family protein [Hymenobacter sp. YIM 151500-1]